MEDGLRPAEAIRSSLFPRAPRAAMDQDFVFAVAHPEFYETLTRFPTTPLYADAVRELVPGEWTLGRSGPWLHVTPPEPQVPRQGFKIHVSSTHQHALGVLGAVVPELVRREIPFKLAADPGLLGVLSAKGYDRGGAGKFMTVYPPDPAAFAEILEALHHATVDTPFVGPYILSDRRFRDSRILFYRYGGMRPVQRLAVDGTRYDLLTAPDGSDFRDVRAPYFQLPPWVQDPFGGAQELEGDPGAPLGGRFTVQSVLAATNRGGVYLAADAATGETVVLKEARPHVNRITTDGHSLDGLDFLRNEHHVLTRLAPLGHTPRPVALFEEWEHLFLAEEKVEGMGLKRFLAQHENLFLPFLHRPGVLEGYLPRFRAVAGALVEAVERIHALGIVLGDLSINNVMVDPDTLRVSLIDVESGVAVAEQPALAKFSYYWFTPGFAREDRSRGEVRPLCFADDHFALGMVLLYMVVGGAQFTILQPGGAARLLDRLCAIGIPAAIRHAIEALFESDLAEARDALGRLPAA